MKEESGRHLEATGGASGNHLEASWRQLGRHLDHNGPQGNHKSHQNTENEITQPAVVKKNTAPCCQDVAMWQKCSMFTGRSLVELPGRLWQGCLQATEAS